MNTISHTFAGILVLKLLSVMFPDIFLMTFPMMMLSIIFANLPDIDVLWSKKLNEHHKSILHAPIFWVSILFIGLVISQATNLISDAIILLFFIQGVFHLFFDFIFGRTVGVPLFYPLSDKEYSLYPLRPKYSDFNPWFSNTKKHFRYIRHYLKNETLVAFEFAIAFFGLLVLFF